MATAKDQAMPTPPRRGMSPLWILRPPVASNQPRARASLSMTGVKMRFRVKAMIVVMT